MQPMPTEKPSAQTERRTTEAIQVADVARPASTWRTFLRWLQLHPVYAALSASLVLVLIIAFFVWRNDQVSLRVVTVEPSAPGTPVSTLAQMRIRFEQPLASTAAEAALTFSPPISGQVTIAGDELRFTPDHALQADTAYQARLEPGLVDQQGRLLRQAVTWTFQTAAAQMVFLAADAEGQLQLFRTPLRPSQGRPRQLTAAPYGVSKFAVAPDGQAVVYSAVESDGAENLWRIGFDQPRDPELLLACPQAICTDPAWSPDGKLLAISARIGDETTARAVAPLHLWLLDLGTGENTRVFPEEPTFSYGAQWSSDGQWITFNIPDGVGAYAMQDGRISRLTSTTFSGGTWRPQHQEFVLSREWPVEDLLEVHMFLADPEQGDKLDLSQHEQPVVDGAPAWSPDGEWLAFRRAFLDKSGQRTKAQIWLMRPDGADQVQVTDSAEFEHDTPTWTADGRYLAFTRAENASDLATSSIWVRDMETGVAWEAAKGQNPQWLP